MAKTSYPNQDMVTIHKERYDGNFLQVSIDEWTTAFTTLKPGTFGLYLYLCGNMLQGDNDTFSRPRDD